MIDYSITVRMADKGAPEVTVSAREEYRHAQQGEMVGATSTVEADTPKALTTAIQKALQAVLDEHRVVAEDVAYQGAIVSAAASVREANAAKKK